MREIDYAIINLSDTCFFQCKMCSFWKNKQAVKYLPAKHYDLFFDEMQKVTDKLFVSFTGGEAITHPDIYSIISSASRRGFYTSLNTNGWLIDDQAIEKLYDSGLSHIAFSLEGLSPTNDGIRKRGSFSRVISSAKRIRAYYRKRGKKIVSSVTTVISALNIEKIFPLVRYIDASSDFDAQWIQAVTVPLGETSLPNLIRPGETPWFERREFSHLWPERSQVISAYIELMHMKQKGSKITNSEYQLKMQYNYLLHPKMRDPDVICAIYKGINIGVDGRISFCPMKDASFARLEDGLDLRKTLSSDKVRRLKEDVRSCKENCHLLLNCGLPGKPITKVESC